MRQKFVPFDLHGTWSVYDCCNCSLWLVGAAVVSRRVEQQRIARIRRVLAESDLFRHTFSIAFALAAFCDVNLCCGLCVALSFVVDVGGSCVRYSSAIAAASVLLRDASDPQSYGRRKGRNASAT